MNSIIKKLNITAALLALTISGTSCGAPYYSGGDEYNNYDLGLNLGIEFPEVTPDFAAPLPVSSIEVVTERTLLTYNMRVIETLKIYDSIKSTQPVSQLLSGTEIILADTETENWTAVYDMESNLIGYTDEGFLRSINAGMGIYAELPIEYGTARDADNNMVEAYSQLVDISKYLNVCYSTDPFNENIDFAAYDVIICMKLSTNDTVINQPFYTRNLCMLQYETLQKLIKAIKIFKKDGYTPIIYDAYRPTGVQQRWFDEVQINNWVANPAIGLGGIHDRGAAIDINLIDKFGVEFEMPTPVYTMSEKSSRTSTALTKTESVNINYISKVMTSCGFKYSQAKWWHYEDENAAAYLPTDHAIDEIPMIPS